MARKKAQNKHVVSKKHQLAIGLSVLLLATGVLMAEGCKDDPLPTPSIPQTEISAAEAAQNERAHRIRENIGTAVAQIDQNIEQNSMTTPTELIEKGLDKAQIAAERGLGKASSSIAGATAQAEALDRKIEHAKNSVAEIANMTGPDEQGAVVTKNYGPFDIENCYVIKIADGDTATCLKEDKKTQVKIRFAQIDAPESKQDFGTVSKQALSDLIFNKNVDLLIEETDRYGRSVSEVFIDGVNVNQYMVKNGYAWAYKEYMTNPIYSELQSSAQASKKGLWSHKNPIYPQDFRKKQAADRQAAKQQ